MPRVKPETDKEQNMLKRWRRARGGRILPRSGDGVHEDKKSKKIEDQIEEDHDIEVRRYIAGYSDDYDLEDDIMTEEEVQIWEEYKEELQKEKEEWEKYRVKPKEKKDATTDR